MLHRAVLLFVFAGPALAQAPAPQAATLPTIVVEGRVVDMRGEGVPVARIRVTRADDATELARGVADGEGFFRIGGVPQPGSLRVLASSEGRCTGSGYVGELGEPVRIVVHDAATVRGTLRNRAGEPVAGAVVQAAPMVQCLSDATVLACTDAYGGFELRAVPLGRTRFAAVVPDEGLAQQMQSVTADVAVPLRVDDTPTATLRIVVKGVPAGATGKLKVLLSNYFPPPWDRPVFDAHGVCELRHVPAREYWVIPWGDDLWFEPSGAKAVPAAGSIEVEFTASRDLPTTFLASAAGVVRGKVLRPDGVQAAYTRIDLEQQLKGEAWVLLRRASATCGREGTFELESTHRGPGLLRLRARSIDGVVVSEPFMPVEDGVQLDLGDLRQLAAATIEGGVRGADGAPAAGVSVWRFESDSAAGSDAIIDSVEVVTDRLGRYRFVGVPPGVKLTVSLGDTEADSGALPPFAVEPGRTYTIDLKLPAR